MKIRTTKVTRIERIPTTKVAHIVNIAYSMSTVPNYKTW